MFPEKCNEFFNHLTEANKSVSWSVLTLSKPRLKNQLLLKVSFRPLVIGNKPTVQGTFTLRHKEEVKNFPANEFPAIARILFDESFLFGHLVTSSVEGHLMVSARGFETLKWKKNEANLSTSPKPHDHTKQYLIPPDAPFLTGLGIAGQNGQILKDGYKKYRQINKFIEIFDSLIGELPTDQAVHVVDMGCGKGYLTFSVYDYLKHTIRLLVNVTGVDLKENVINDGNILAKKLGFSALTFREGSISAFSELNPDILIALHACDTATDDALYYGLTQKSKIIIVSPCCQKQVRKSIDSDDLGLFRYGIIEERFASDLTDLIRANILRYFGYQTRIIEFISNEHTAKNLMITAVYNGRPQSEALDEIRNWMSLFHIKSHYLMSKTGLEF